MKICDLTQFYSPVSGGVKRYLGEKVRYMREHRPGDEHVLIVPGERDDVTPARGQRVYTVGSPLISRTSQYRLLLRLDMVERILERERPDLIESGDPYQVGWKAMHSGRGLQIPALAFYHSHFPEAYLRPAKRFLGSAITEFLVDFSRRYVRCLYNEFARTLVPSPALGEVLTGWGVHNVVPTDLGVDTSVFRPDPVARETVRGHLGIAPGEKLLLYVGRLAAEKNTLTLFEAYRRLHRTSPSCHLLIIGMGLQNTEMEALRAECPRVQWMPYCGEPSLLASHYSAADLFVHPGVQETFGLATLEAQACGTPVVGIRGSYMDRIIYGGQEAWAQENTPEALAEAVRHALRRHPPVDPVAMAAEMARRFSWERVFEGLFDLYGQVIAEYQTRCQ